MMIVSFFKPQFVLFKYRWLRLKSWIFDNKFGCLLWNICGIFDWDVWLFGKGFKYRFNVSLFRWRWRKWCFEKPNNAGGSFLSFTKFKADGHPMANGDGWHLSFNNMCEGRWVFAQRRSGTLYPTDKINWTWWPFWYPKKVR